MIEQTSTQLQHERSTKRIAARRRLVALAIGVGALFGVGAEHAVVQVASNIHEVQEYGQFSKLGISKELAKNDIDPASVLITTVQPGQANPTEVAQQLRAKDVPALANTIAAQIGGELNMTSGQELAIPRDLLETPPQK